jgi:holo-[acyl-carrier protein] synthase
MEIAGLGTHVLETPRVRQLIDAHAEKFLHQVYTERELAYCRDRTHSTEYYAAFWAAKEAVFRSLGTKWRRGMDWREVELLCESAIEPAVEVTGTTRERMDQRRVTSILVSFSYSRLFATATAIAVRNGS